MASSRRSTAMSRPPSARPKATEPNETSKPSSTSSPATCSLIHPFETATSLNAPRKSMDPRRLEFLGWQWSPATRRAHRVSRRRHDLAQRLGRSALTAPARRHRRAQRQPAGCRGFLFSFPDRPNGFHSDSGAAPGSFFLAAFNGALFCITYATYNLTNQATLRNWTTQLTLI